MIRGLFPKECTERVKFTFYVATLTSSLSMPGCQVGGDPADVSHTHSLGGKRGGDDYMM